MQSGLKRSRPFDEEDDVDGLFSESKKLRTLPFRSSPTTQHTTPSFSSRSRAIQRPNILTPIESSEDESDYDLASPKDTMNRPSISLYLQDADNDVDMDASESFDQPVWSPKVPDSAFASSFPPSARSSLSVNTPSARSLNTQTPRLPTPIYGHFSSPSYPVDMPPPSPAMAPPTYINTLTFPRIRSSGESITDSFLRRRALPSPISEDENMESPTVLTKTMLGNLKMSASPLQDQFVSQATLTPDTPSTKNWINVMNPAPRNRRRSDAITGESGKIMFSMGFRADCDKCRERVPGHYSHVIRI